MSVGDRNAYDYYCCTWVMVVELALRENIPDLAVSSVKNVQKRSIFVFQMKKKINKNWHEESSKHASKLLYCRVPVKERKVLNYDPMEDHLCFPPCSRGFDEVADVVSIF